MTLHSLGNAYYLQSRHSEACEALEGACKGYHALGAYQHSYSQCLRLLEQIRTFVQLGKKFEAITLEEPFIGTIFVDNIEANSLKDTVTWV
jgi:hypothetical protein